MSSHEHVTTGSERVVRPAATASHREASRTEPALSTSERVHGVSGEVGVQIIEAVRLHHHAPWAHRTSHASMSWESSEPTVAHPRLAELSISLENLAIGSD